MKRLFLVSMLLIFVFSSLVFAQPRSGSPIHKGQPPSPKVSVVSLRDPLADFAKQGLPKAYVFGGIPNKALAKKAADMILKNDEDSLPALIGALQLAGFYIVDKNKKILFVPPRANGAAFKDFEVAGLLRGSYFGIGSTLEKYGKTVAGNSPKLDKFDIGSGLLADLQGARNSKDEQNLFLAELIFALGNGTNELTSPQSKLNFIQASLIERRFLTDLVSAYENVSGGQSLINRQQNFNKTFGEVFVNASYNNFITRNSYDSPCPNVETMEDAIGYKGKGEKVAKFFGYEHAGKQALNDIMEKSDLLQEVSQGVEKANLIMTYLKLLISNLFIEADIDVPNSPLVRTKSNLLINRGQERIVTAKFKVYFPNSSEINCVGKAIKIGSDITGFGGPEFEVPQEGPMKEIPVKWEPLDKAEVAPLYVDSLDGKSVYNQKTDTNGENKIKATGKEQKKNLENIPVSPVPKYDHWKVSVATENMDAEKDLPKIFFGALGLKGGSPISFLMDFVPEVLAKMALRSFKVNIPVRDWEPCTEDWSGRINYTKDFFKKEIIKASRTSNGNSTGDGVRTIDVHEEAEITLNPRTKEEVAARIARKHADIDLFGYYSTQFEGNREKDPCCGKNEGSFNTKFTSGTETKFSKKYTAPFNVSFSGGNNDFSLGFNFDIAGIPSKVHDYLQVLDTTCPLEKQESYDRNSDSVTHISADLSSGRYGDRYLDVSGDFLVGSKKYQLPGGETVNWEWELSRCKP